MVLQWVAFRILGIERDGGLEHPATDCGNIREWAGMRNLGTVPISENEFDVEPGGDRSPSQTGHVPDQRRGVDCAHESADTRGPMTQQQFEELKSLIQVNAQGISRNNEMIGLIYEEHGGRLDRLEGGLTGLEGGLTRLDGRE